jgi:hypothetical protein
MTNGFDRAALRHEPVNEGIGADYSDDDVRAMMREDEERRNRKYDAALRNLEAPVRPMTPDLIALLEQGLRKPPRGDEALPHASDTVCDRQAWARRRGEEFMEPDFRTIMKWELGVQFERGVGDILEVPLRESYVVLRDVECGVGAVVGHADFIALDYQQRERSFVLEIKSTSFLRGKVPEEASPWYVEQAAIYALALNVARFGVLVGCRESGKLAPVFWFDLDGQRYEEPQTWREWAESRAAEIVTLTDPEAQMPPAEPRTGWACKTCRWLGCEKNPGYVDTDTLTKLEESYAIRNG